MAVTFRMKACWLLLACSLLLITQSHAKSRWTGYSERGQASFYAHQHQGRRTASGERYQHHKLTAAHRKLPFGSQVKVTNLRNGKTTIVRINERGPFVKGRILDLSQSAFRKLAPLSAGTIPVKIERLDKNSGCTKNCSSPKR